MMRVVAPGRVNLIGDHTDYTGGLVLPMAIQLETTLDAEPLPGRIELTSADAPGVVSLALPVDGDPARLDPPWAAYVAAVARELGDTARGIRGHLSSTLPLGAGLSSSAALECAVAVGLGFDGPPQELARLARRAEHAATGTPTGIMDQLCITSARAGHATLIDCATLEVEHVPVPTGVEVVVQHVAARSLRSSAYATRVEECRRAEAIIGPLRRATIDDVERLDDPVLRRRARHVVSENDRVRAVAAALRAGDVATVGSLMTAGHASLRHDFEVSTVDVDDAVAALLSTPGVFGARITGGGFGGCLVALCEPGAVTDGWVVSPSAGVRRR